MNLIFFLFIVSFFSIALGEFGQFPFASTGFSIALTDILLTLNLSVLLIWNIGIKKNLIFPKRFIFLIIFWVIGILSLFFSLDLSGWFYLLRFIIYSSVFYLTYHLIKSGIFKPNQFMSLLKLTSVTLAVIGFFQLIFFPDLEILTPLGYDPHKYRLFSTFLDPNFFGSFLNFGFSIVIYELISKKFTSIDSFFKENKWNVISAILLGSAILLTFSRSAYLMLAVSMLIILGKNRKILTVFLVLVSMLYLIFPPFSTRINGAINVDASARERFSSWDKGLIIFKENPILGVGFNNIRNYSMQMDLVKLYSTDGGNSGSGVDSSLLFILATTGLVGFITFILFLLKVTTDLVFNKNVSQFAIPFFALTIGLLVSSFFINSLFYPPIMFLWFSILGVFYGLGEGEGS